MKLNESIFEEERKPRVKDIVMTVYDKLSDMGYVVYASDAVEGFEISKKKEENLKRAKDYLDELGIKYRVRKFADKYYMTIMFTQDQINSIKEGLQNGTFKEDTSNEYQDLLRKESRVKDYRKFADIDEDEIITEDALNDWAIRRTCRLHNCDRDKLVSELTEDIDTDSQTLKDAAQAAKDIDDTKVVDARSKGQIERALDWALDYNQEQHDLGERNFQNLLFIGEAGTGKTAITRAWAKANNVNLFEVRAAGMDDTDLGGAISPSEDRKTVVRLASTEFDKLNRPNSVLFLDEYNRAPQSVRTQLLELINSHVVPDEREPSGQRYLENFLFTVAAINPANANYNTDTLDMAERTRFRNIDVIPDPKNLLKHLTSKFQEQADKASTEERKKRALGRVELAKALLSSKDFEFDSKEDIEKTQDSGNGLALNYRTLTNLLIGSDGTKEDFLAKWNEYTNSQKKKMAERILANYVDIDDKANQALKSETKSNVFSTKSTYDKLMDELNKL